MNNYNKTPQITVYSPDRRLALGTVTHPINLTEDIRFNAASEVQFSVPEYFYDSDFSNYQRSQQTFSYISF